MALGLAATTAIFSILHAVVLRPLPYQDPDTLVAIESANVELGVAHSRVSMADFVDWRRQLRSFERIAASGHATAVLTSAGQPEELPIAAVTTGLFEALGVRPELGRPFLPEEETPGRDTVVLLSHEMWQQRFGGDPGVVGRKLDLSGLPYLVVGVMPRGFHYPDRAIELWSPMALDPEKLVRKRRGMTVVARLKPGTSPEQAEQELRLVTRQMAEAYPDTNRGWGASVTPLHDKLVRDARPALYLLLGATLFVLLIACANVSNLLLMRASIARSELALRSALGAPRGAVLRQIVADSLVLSLASGVLAVVLSSWGTRVLVSIAPHEVFRLEDAGLSTAVLLFAVGLSVATGLLLGVLPAINSLRTDLWDSLVESDLRGGRGTGRNRTAEILVVAEIATVLLLLIGSGLLIRSFARLTAVDPGFREEKLLVSPIALPLNKYPDGHQQRAFFEGLVDRIASLPGVGSIATSSAVPMNQPALNLELPFAVEGRRDSDSVHEQRAEVRLVSPGYFRTLGVPLAAGRDFADRDGEDDASRVAVINETMASRFWPEEVPLARRFAMSYRGENLYEVVGVVADVRHFGLDESPRPQIYLSSEQFPFFFATVVTRTETDPMSLVKPIQTQVWNLDPNQAVDFKTMEEIVDRSVADRRFTLQLLIGFTVLALSLTVVGVYATMAYGVVRRRTEIGIRMALGAQATDVMGEVLSRGLKVTLAGVAIGLLGAYAGTRLLAGFLFGVSATDVTTFVAAGSMLVMAALCGSYVPARRAVRVDPILALRYE